MLVEIHSSKIMRMTCWAQRLLSIQPSLEANPPSRHLSPYPSRPSLDPKNTRSPGNRGLTRQRPRRPSWSSQWSYWGCLQSWPRSHPAPTRTLPQSGLVPSGSSHQGVRTTIWAVMSGADVTQGRETKLKIYLK